MTGSDIEELELEAEPLNRVTSCEDGEDKEEVNAVPIDTGWAWVICFGTFLMYFLVVGSLKVFGLFLVECVEAYDMSVAAVAVAPALQSAIMAIMCLGGSVLLTRFNHRTVLLWGGFLCTVGHLIGFFASSIALVIIGVGIISGIGFGICFTASVSMLGFYFKRRLGLANCLSSMGAGVSSLVLPPLTDFLIQTYSFRGAFLILGGLLLNLWVAAMLSRPLDYWDKLYRKTHAVLDDRFVLVTESGTSLPDLVVPAITITDGEGQTRLVQTGQGLGSNLLQSLDKLSLAWHESQLSLANGESKHAKGDKDKEEEGEKEETVAENTTKNGELQDPASKNEDDGTGEDAEASKHTEEEAEEQDVVVEVTRVPRKRRRTYTVGSYFDIEARDREKERSRKVDGQFSVSGGWAFPASVQSLNLSRMHLPDASAKNIKDHKHEIHDPYIGSLQSVPGMAAQQRRSCWAFLCERSGDTPPLLDCSLFKNRLLLLYFLAQSLVSMVYPLQFVLLPAHYHDIGLTGSEAAHLLIISGVGDIVGRLIAGIIADLPRCRAIHVWVVSITVVAINAFLISFMTAFWSSGIYIFIFGVFGAGAYSMQPLVCVELAGVKALAQSFGVMSVSCSVFYLLGFPLAGAIRDATGSYLSVFYVCGGVAAFSVLVMLPILFFSRTRRQS